MKKLTGYLKQGVIDEKAFLSFSITCVFGSYDGTDAGQAKARAGLGFVYRMHEGVFGLSGLLLLADWICGISGYAFFLNIHPELCPSGPTAFDNGFLKQTWKVWAFTLR